MKKKLTELVFILDKSGSMSGLEADTVGGFNSLVEKQREVEGECLVSMILFNDKSELIYDRHSVSEIRKMRKSDFTVGGTTALMDALGAAINHISKIHKYIREEDVPENTIFVIMTDGMENASHIFSDSEVKALVEEKKEKCGWQFIFLAANIDAVETARKYGIDEDSAANYCSDSQGTKLTYEAVNDAVENYRTARKVNRGWKKELENDLKRRK